MNEDTRLKLRLGLAVLAVLTLFGIGSFALAHERRQTERAACERSVAARDDNRAMWLFLIDRLDPKKAQEPDTVAFVNYLDRRLPRVICVNEKLVAVEDD